MIVCADCVKHMATMAENSVDAVITDPPYELNFMGKNWDKQGVSFKSETWKAVLRVLKPGGYLLSFGGTRTSHRIVCAIEDAGFEIRDSIVWLYGSGFPKSHNLPNGVGTALKPAHEPICLARKPLAESTVAANVAAWGTGGLNIDGCRIEGTTRIVEKDMTGYHGNNWGAGHVKAPVLGYHQNTAGRWPANVALSHTEQCRQVGTDRGYADADGRETVAAWECADDCPVRLLDEQSGERRSVGHWPKRKRGEITGWSGGWSDYEQVERHADDTGGASRFFYCAKASRAEREAGLESLHGWRKIKNGWEYVTVANNHPTVKPLKLMDWLVRLVTPVNSIVFDPFMGSGTTGCAAVRQGFRFVGIDDDPNAVQIAKLRIKYHSENQING